MAKTGNKAPPHLRIRIEPELLARLEKSREAHGRTLTGEITHRIEQTFRKSDDAGLVIGTLQAAFAGATGNLLLAIAGAMGLIERGTGKKWDEDLSTYTQVRHAVDEIITSFHPTQSTEIDRETSGDAPLSSTAKHNLAVEEVLQILHKRGFGAVRRKRKG